MEINGLDKFKVTNVDINGDIIVVTYKKEEIKKLKRIREIKESKIKENSKIKESKIKESKIKENADILNERRHNKEEKVRDRFGRYKSLREKVKAIHEGN